MGSNAMLVWKPQVSKMCATAIMKGSTTKDILNNFVINLDYFVQVQ